MIAQRLGGQMGNGPIGQPEAEGGNNESTRAFLRERIEKLQARLAELDQAGDGVEDATVVEETPGKKA